MSKQIKSRIRLINIENKLMLDREKGVKGWSKWVKGSRRSRLAVME